MCSISLSLMTTPFLKSKTPQDSFKEKKLKRKRIREKIKGFLREVETIMKILSIPIIVATIPCVRPLFLLAGQEK